MFTYISLFATIAALIVITIIAINAFFKKVTDTQISIGVFCSLTTLLFVPMWLSSWSHNASDIAKIKTHAYSITTYQNRVTMLDARLRTLNDSSSSIITVNHDTPLASVVGALQQAEAELASITDQRNRALQRLYKRSIGPFPVL